MRNLSYSFKPNGAYFIFNADTGKTVAEVDEYGRPLKTVRRARREWCRLRTL